MEKTKLVRSVLKLSSLFLFSKIAIQSFLLVIPTATIKIKLQNMIKNNLILIVIEQIKELVIILF